MIRNAKTCWILLSAAIIGWGSGCSSNIAEGIKKDVQAIKEDLKGLKDGLKELADVRKEIKELRAIKDRLKADMDGIANAVGSALTNDENIVDEAQKAGLTRKDFPQSDHDAFKGMDKSPTDPDYKWSKKAIMGRNTWIAWNAGNQRMWDYMARYSFGWIDLLKVVDTSNRAERFDKMGLINEPGMASRSAAEGDVAENPYGVQLDVPKSAEARQALFDKKYSLYRTEGLDPSVHGYSSGVLGLRLFPNPEFFEKPANQADWKPKDYYDNPPYFESPKLVRPYRVGVTCGICHVAYNPIYPPDDPAEPDWSNLSSNIGNQYFREGKVFGHNIDLQPKHEQNFYWQVLDRQLPGTSDTSRIATDHINGPTAINAIFLLPERTRIAVNEVMGAGAKILPPQVDANGQRQVPHILRDGADSIGVPGATIRVYVNIGLFSEYWLKRHNPGVGLISQKPFEIEVAHKNSVYWQATEDRLENAAHFLSYPWPMQLKYAKLKDGTTGQEYIDKQPGDLERGKVVFAENCARCHSSKSPPPGIDRDSDQGKVWFVQAVKQEDFWKDNFLSEDRRHNVNEKGLGTNASRAMGSNAARGHIWDNFSSENYKEQLSVGTINGGWGKNSKYSWEPETVTFPVPAGGRGHYRTPSLVAIWATAPFLASNSVGKFTGDPSVLGRLEAFHDAAEKLLGLKPRHDANNDGVWRTKGESYLELPGGVFPKEFRVLANRFSKELGLDEDWVDGSPVKFGPIPEGTTINLLMNLDLTLKNFDGIAKLLVRVKKELHVTKDMPAEEAKEHMANTLVPLLLENNLCPDFVMDKGHTFANELSEEDRRSLIKLLLTF